MHGMHFEHMATDYAGARPPYPDAIFDSLEQAGVIGGDREVLEIGAGSGLATEQLVRRGSRVVALEPGERLAALTRAAVPDAEVVTTRLEDAQLLDHAFDSVVSATSLHWVDLSIGLRQLHAALRPRGWMAVWRTVFGDESVRTPFRDRVAQIVSQREPGEVDSGREPRPTMSELVAGGWFESVRTETWSWSVDLSTDQVRRLFTTFSDWTTAEAEAAAQAADDLGGRVTEHYRSVLHLLRSTETE